MNFGELIVEVGDRGFNDLLRDQESRVKRWVNEAHREICDLASWPFLEASQEGPAPLTITALAHVLSVSNLTTDAPLLPLDRRRVVGVDPALNDTGVAEYWYREGAATIKAYPADTGSTLVVRYLRAVTDLVGVTDEPLVPSPYHGLIVDGAVIRAYRNRDNFQAAQFVRQEWRIGVAGMEHALLKPNYDRERKIARTGRLGDYL
jgi:hypothetical protein